MTDDPVVPELPDEVDALVVGGGPAGSAAATWLGRYRRRTLLVDAGEPRNRWVEKVNGLPGLDPVAPADLREQLRRGLTAYPHVTRVDGRVTSIEHREDANGGGDFVATIGRGTTVRARRVVLATGVRDRFPALERFEEHYGADVFHCPSCEGFDARDRDVVVLGWGPHIPAFGAELLDWARSVTIVTDGPLPQVSPAQVDACRDLGMVFVTDDPAEGLLGERGAMRGVRLASGRVLPSDIAFFSIGHDPNVALAVALGCELDEDGVIVVDADAGTTVAGVYACGDVTPGMQLVAVALGKGTTAGVACATSLHGDTTSPQSPPSAPDPSSLAADTERRTPGPGHP